jgi:hypothetical protein
MNCLQAIFMRYFSCLTALAIGSHRVANIKNPWAQGEDFLAGLGQDIQSYSLPIPDFSLF